MSAVTIGGRQSARMGTDAWLTPRSILDALGEFDLDPCSAPDPRRWPTARNHYTLPRDGLAMPWYGRVFLNPPYGKHARVWLARMAEHGIGTALVFNRSETSWYRTSITRHPNATAVFLLAGRVKFVRPGTYDAPDNGGAPSVLVAYGHRDAEILARCGLDGDFLPLPGRASRSQSSAGSLVTPAGSRTGISDRDAAPFPEPEVTMNLHEIDALLDGVKGRWDHAEAPHNPDMLAIIRAAEQMRAYIAGIHGDDLADPMPVFVLKGKDRLALRAVHTYVDACDQADLPRQAREVLRAADEMAAWQDRNPDRLKLPDHGHVPVGEALLTAGE